MTQPVISLVQSYYEISSLCEMVLEWKLELNSKGEITLPQYWAAIFILVNLNFTPYFEYHQLFGTNFLTKYSKILQCRE